jgi:hypothetical protein
MVTSIVLGAMEGAKWGRSIDVGQGGGGMETSAKRIAPIQAMPDYAPLVRPTAWSAASTNSCTVNPCAEFHMSLLCDVIVFFRTFGKSFYIPWNRCNN